MRRADPVKHRAARSVNCSKFGQHYPGTPGTTRTRVAGMSRHPTKMCRKADFAIDIGSARVNQSTRELGT
eukprot:2679368-Rhodomonas_salina.3